jgi:predicted nucleotidyltransferase
MTGDIAGNDNSLFAGVLIKLKESNRNTLGLWEVCSLKEFGVLNSDEIKALLAEVVETYKTIIREKLVEVVLYGSYARGSEEEYSDVDILALIDDSDENIKQLDRILEDFHHDMIMKYSVLLSPILVSYPVFTKYHDVLPFYMNVEREGVVVYERKVA